MLDDSRLVQVKQHDESPADVEEWISTNEMLQRIQDGEVYICSKHEERKETGRSTKVMKKGCKIFWQESNVQFVNGGSLVRPLKWKKISEEVPTDMDWISTQEMFAQSQVGERYEVQFPDTHPARDCYNGWAERLESDQIVWQGTSSLTHPVNPITCKWRKVKESGIELTTSQLLEQLQEGQRAQMVNGQPHWNVCDVWKEENAIWYLDGDGERALLPMSDGVMAAKWKLIEVKQPEITERQQAISLAKQLLENELTNANQRYFAINGSLCDAEFIVNRDKRTIACLMRGINTKKVHARGIAKCMPSDCFNVHIGKAIALCRAIGNDVPDYLLSAPNPTEPQVGDVIEFHTRKGMPFKKDKVIEVTVTSSGVFCEASKGTIKFIPGYGDRVVDDSRE
ncbi:hypothetical protein [Aneurinibacillus soli]|uniref:hypothetical protein n=1 Tax=Aneurinibacillus soli TaxID=1500254 RepID=UPI001E3374E8|nr:hypothetical protein [Aneurinibacillus soli]